MMVINHLNEENHDMYHQIKKKLFEILTFLKPEYNIMFM